METNQNENRYEVQLLHKGKKYHLLQEIFSGEGKMLSRVVTALDVHVDKRDIMEMIFGALFVVMPFGFTDEAARIGEELSLGRALVIVFLAIVIIATYLHQIIYRHLNKPVGSHPHFYWRIITTYGIALIVAIFFLTLIDQVDWRLAALNSFKKALVLSLPAAFGAVTVDTWKRNEV